MTYLFKQKFRDITKYLEAHSHCVFIHSALCVFLLVLCLFALGRC
jgi:hypothetical protein